MDILNTIMGFIQPIIDTIMGLIGGGEGGGFDISSITDILGGLLG